MNRNKPEVVGKPLVRAANAFAMLAQLLTVAALVVLIGVGRLSLRIPLDQRYIIFDEDMNTTKDTAHLANLPVAWVLFAMCTLTAISHGISILPGIFDTYYALGEAGFNAFVWVEYSLTSTLMALVLLLLTGVSELSSALPLAAFLGFTNLLGGLVPEYIQYCTPQRRPSFQTTWLPFVICGLMSLMPWVTILAYFWSSVVASSASVPLWLWFSFIGTFFQFNSFGFVFFAQRVTETNGTKWAKNKPYVWMIAYAALSLSSKMFLTWFFIGGVLTRS